MASRSKPLISAAALASAAAIAVATPAVAPNLGMPTPAALSKAAYELTTFADVLSIPTEVWTDLLFANTTWGGTLGYPDPEDPDKGFGPEWARPQIAFNQAGYVNPWVVYCNFKCDRTGIAGVSYLFLDALINGNGNGFDDSENWPIGFVNYFAEPSGFFPIGGNGNSPQFAFENLGYSAAAWYILQGTLGQAVPELTVPIASLFWGELNVTVGYNLVLQTAAGLLQAVPLVGPITGNSILAYLGDLLLDPDDPGLGFYQYGLSGVLNYWIDIATGAVPFPGAPAAPTPPEAASLAAAAVSAEAAPATEVSAVTEDAASAPVDVAENAPADAPIAPAATVEVTPASDPAVEAEPAVEADPGDPIEASSVEVEETVVGDDVSEALPADVPEVDLDVKELADLADLDAAVDAPAETPKGVVSGGVKDAGEQSTASVGTATTGDSGGAGDSSDAGDSADSGSAGSDSAGSDSGDSDN